MEKKQKSYESATIKKLANSSVEITGSVSANDLEKHRAEAIKHFNQSVKIDGFRQGMIPENILISKVGEMAILEEMAEHALSHAYMEIIMDNKLDAIGRPNIQVTKLAKDNPLEFKITTAVVPEVNLPDYKIISSEIAKKQNVEDLKVTDKDMNEAILRIRKSAVPNKKSHDHVKNETADTHIHPDEMKTDSKVADTDLPEFDDAFVKKLGDFADVADFKEKLKVMLAGQKRDQQIEKVRIQIADAIAEKTTVEIPEILIQSEINRIESQFNDDIERMGVKIDDYLKHAKKTIDEVRKEWRPHAEKKAKLQLILNSIAQKENIKPAQNEIEQEVDHIIEHYKDADRERAATYAETVLTNEKVFQYLEKTEK